jgi:hypothetical protein
VRLDAEPTSRGPGWTRPSMLPAPRSCHLLLNRRAEMWTPSPCRRFGNTSALAPVSASLRDPHPSRCAVVAEVARPMAARRFVED